MPDARKVSSALGTAAKIMLGLISVVLVVSLVWGCPAPTEAAQPGANPFEAATARMAKAVPSAVVKAVKLADIVTADNRGALLNELSVGQTFLTIDADRQVTRTPLPEELIPAYREYVDSLLEVGDQVFKIEWSINDQLLSNLALASPVGPKLEPIMSTTLWEIRRAVAMADVRPRQTTAVALAASRPSAPTPPTRDQFELVNILDVRVVWGSLDIVPLGNTLVPDVRRGSRMLWTVTEGRQDQAPSRRGACLDVKQVMNWASTLPNFKIGLTAIEFNVQPGLVLQSGQVSLLARRCRP